MLVNFPQSLIYVWPRVHDKRYDIYILSSLSLSCSSPHSWDSEELGGSWECCWCYVHTCACIERYHRHCSLGPFIFKTFHKTSTHGFLLANKHQTMCMHIAIMYVRSYWNSTWAWPQYWYPRKKYLLILSTLSSAITPLSTGAYRPVSMYM